MSAMSVGWGWLKIHWMPVSSFTYPKPNNDTVWETVCCHVFARILGVESLQKFRRQGQIQYGIDLIATRTDGLSVVVQCKVRNTGGGLSRRDAEVDLEAAKGLIDTATGERVRIGCFVIATTDSTNEHTAWAANVTRKHAAIGLFEVKVYTWPDIENIFNQDSTLRAWYLGCLELKSVELALPVITAAMVQDFLLRLAEKGLAKRMLFPPPKWQGQSLRNFCIEPRILTEARWDEHRRTHSNYSRAAHEMELASEESIRVTTREKGILLGRVLGEKTHLPRHRRVILRGNPGEGKSTALWMHIGNQCASLISQLTSGEVGIDSAEFKFPLVLPLGDAKLENTDLVSMAIEKVLEISFGRGQDVTVRALRKWLCAKTKRGEYSLALDALDELSLPAGLDGPTWLREQFQDIPHFVPILLTTRPNTIDTTLGLNIGQPSGQFEIYRMICFGKAQIGNYVRGYFGEDWQKAESLLSRLRQSPGPKQLAQLPLLLAVLCHAHSENDPNVPLASTRTMLLSTALWHLFGEGHRKRSLKLERRQRGKRSVSTDLASDPLRNRLKEMILQDVAWKFWKDGPMAMRESDLQIELAKALAALKTTSRGELSWAKEPSKRLKLAGLIEELCEDGILVPMLSEGQNHFRFVLRSFHEYLVGGYIASEEIESVRARIIKFINNQGWFSDVWRRIWPLAAGQGSHIATQFLSSCDPPHYLTYGHERFDKVLPAFLAEIVSESKSSQAPYWVDQLVKLAGSEPRVNAAIVGALGEIGGPTAERQLLDWMLDASANPLEVYGAWHEWMPNKIIKALANIANFDTTGALIQRLSSAEGPPVHRARCASVLGRIGGPSCRDALIDCLRSTADDETGDVRFQCALALGEIGDSQSRDALIAQLLLGTDAYGCAIALGRIGDVESRSALIACFCDRSNTDEWLLAGCANALDEIGDAESSSALIGQLAAHVDGQTDWLRCQYVRAIRNIGDADSRAALITSLDAKRESSGLTVRCECAEALGDLRGPEGRAALVACLLDPTGDDNGDVRAACAAALKKIGDDVCRSALLARWREPANDPNGAVRYACAVALEELESVEGRSGLMARLSSPASDEKGSARRACAAALGEIGDVESRSALIARLKDPLEDEAGEVRIACAKALAKISDEVCFEALLDRLVDNSNDQTGGIRYECAKALELTGSVEVRPVLITRLLNAAGDETAFVREECADHLGKIGDAESRSALIARLSDKSEDEYGAARRACAAALGRIGDADSSGALIAVLSDASDDRDLRGFCAEALGRMGDAKSKAALMATLDDPKGDTYGQVREHCALALGMAGGDESRSSLIARLHKRDGDEHSRARLGCIAGLRQIGDTKSREALVDCLFDAMNDDGGLIRAFCADELATLGDVACRTSLARRLRDDANDGDGVVRRRCAQALGRIGGRHSRMALTSRLLDPEGDEEGEIRASCAWALARIGDAESRMALTARLDDPTNDVKGWIRLACAKALLALGGNESLEALKRLFTTAKIPDNVRQACYAALAKIDGNNYLD